jgi:protein-S-isoprenylcysteine O-methyltransferase Ste14
MRVGESRRPRKETARVSTTPTPIVSGENRAPASSSPPHKIGLSARVAIRIIAVLTIAICALFLPAGTLRFWQGWVYLGVLPVPSLCAYLYFLKHDPQLVERRLQQKEQVREQKLLMRWFKPLFLCVFLVPGFDYRLGWTRTLLGAVPLWLTVFSQVMALTGMCFASWVITVNRFAGRTIRVEEGQKVISTGPYSIVRHPMYSGSVVLWMFTPLALGSYISVPIFALLIPFYVIRLLNEEKVLREELPGYPEYCLHTRFRLIPFVW